MRPIPMQAMPFGKWKGTHVSVIPSGYLEWVLRECKNGITEQLTECIMEELQRRREAHGDRPPPKKKPRPAEMRRDLIGTVRWFMRTKQACSDN